MNFKSPLSRKLTRRNLGIDLILATVYKIYTKRFPTKTKPFHVIGKVYSHQLEIGEFVVATTNCKDLHPRLKAQMIGRIIGIVDSYQFLVMIRFYPACFYPEKYIVP